MVLNQMETIGGKIKLLTNSWVYIWSQLAFVSSGSRIKFVSSTCVLVSGLTYSRQKEKKGNRKKRVARTVKK